MIMNNMIEAKKAVGMAAAEMVQSGMVVGLGTGSTSSYFINSLIIKCKEGLQIKAVATSDASEHLAKEGGIPFANIDELTSLDICFDGADEIDPKKRMIKGGGGALLREKIVATMSKQMIVLVDESKCVQTLGKFPLPVEIVQFGYNSTIYQINSLGYKGNIRKKKDGSLYMTDSGNYIYDIQLESNHLDPEIIHQSLINIPGVIETGFFLNLASLVLIGKANGKVKKI